MKTVNPNIVEGTVYEIQRFCELFKHWECRAFTNNLGEARRIHRFESKAHPKLKFRIVRVTRKVVAK